MDNVMWYTKEQIEVETDKAVITAMALVNWGNCHAGNTPPEDFGEGMVIVGQKLGISPTVMEYSKSLT